MRTRGTVLETLGLLGLVATAAMVRWAGIGRRMWLDELATSWVIRDAWTDIPPRAILNNLSPLFYGLTWISTRLVGYNEVGMRLPSFVAGVLVVPAVYLVARALTRHPLAAFAAALIATLDDYFIDYSVEARPYSLVQVFALANIYLFVRFERDRSRTSAILMGLNAALLFYLHYTTALFFAVNALLLLLGWIRGPGPSRGEVAGLAAGVAVFAIASLPALPQLLYLVSNKNTLGDFIGPMTLEASVGRFNLLRHVLLPLAFGVVAGHVAGPPPGRPGEAAAPGLSELVMVLLWFLVPLVSAWLLGKLGLVRININRYVISSSVACVLLSVTAIRCACSGRARILTYAFLILMTLIWSRDALEEVRARERTRQPWRDLVARVNGIGPRGVPVYVQAGLIEAKMLAGRDDALFRDYLLCPVNSLYRLRSDLLGRAEPVLGPGSIAGVADGRDFLFIGPRDVLDPLRASAGIIAGRHHKAFDLHFLSGDESSTAGLMAVAVAFRDRGPGEEGRTR
jgi:hypothetical protein